MPDRARQELKVRFIEVLQQLSKEERELFSEVLKIEAKNLHLKSPRVKDDIVQAVRRLIK